MIILWYITLTFRCKDLYRMAQDKGSMVYSNFYIKNAFIESLVNYTLNFILKCI